MNFGEIVLQVGCSDEIIQQIYPVHLLVIVVLISINKNIYVRKQNGGWRVGGRGAEV
jgi:hypothetical protein